MAEAAFTLIMLVLLQAVLGFDNLLYISLESKRAPEDKQSYVRKVGIGLAVIMRIILLFVLVELMGYFEEPWFTPHGDYFSGSFNLDSLITLFGGAFIIYTATKEIWHMMSLDGHENQADSSKSSTGKVIAMIVFMNLVFSFDSILSAMALAKNPDGSYQFWLMATAIIIGGILMIWLADKVSNFLKKNRMYEVLGLFVLFIVGIMLLTEGGHKAHMHLFGNEIVAMSKTTFYFVIVVLIIVDVVQGRYQRNLSRSLEKREDQAVL